MILVALGANLNHPHFGPPQATCEAALAALSARDITVLARSAWFRTAPVPVSDQPWYVNGVASVATSLDPSSLLSVLHEIEDEFGRVRYVRNEARVLDLDLLAYDERVSKPQEAPVLPHPRMAERAFVLFPLEDLAPDWLHPVLGETARALKAALPPQAGAIERVDSSDDLQDGTNSKA